MRWNYEDVELVLMLVDADTEYHRGRRENRILCLHFHLEIWASAILLSNILFLLN